MTQYKTYPRYTSKLLASSPLVLKFIRCAALRTDVNYLSLLERLPNELTLMVIVHIGDPRSIFRLALTGPHLCAFIAVHEGMITESLIRMTIPTELLYLTVATYTAIESCWNVHNRPVDLSSGKLSDSYVDSIVQFVEHYRRSEGFTLRAQHPKGPNLCQALGYLVMHSLTSEYADKLARLSMRVIPKAFGFAPEISPTVLIRYEKALYITQLVAELFAWRGSGQTNRMHLAWGMFWYALAPWEVEQVYCVQTLLTWHVLEEMCRCSVHAIAYNDGFMTVKRFVNYLGPLRLGALEKRRPPDQLIAALKIFKQWNPFGFIHWGHCAPNFGLQLMLDRIGRRLDQSTKDGSLAFNDIDLGPMKNWYCIFLFGRLEEARPGRCHSFFSCMRCLVMSGYAFWDAMDQSRMPAPPISVMHERTVAELKVASQTLDGLDRIVKPIRSWVYCDSEIVMSSWARNQFQLRPRYADEYCYQRIGQTLADEKERMR
ncbi:hypothetical protein F4679DRAFT_592687 [Xylaria curta]|nr:hypothetical protein F4679DRAFT_592687 [Xylaria curta]